MVAISCKKIDVPNSNKIDVELANSGAGFVTRDVTVSPGASFSIDFTVKCLTDMEYVYIYKNGTEISKNQLLTDKTSFTAVKSFTADLASGTYTYRILAKDKAGIYLGEKNIVITVTADFNYYTNITLFVPDSVDKTNKTYYASSTNSALNYITSAGISSTIDFGYFYDPTLTGTIINGHTIYALNISPVPAPIAMYSLTAYTKNATLLKSVTTPSFTSVNSSSALQTAGAGLSSGTATSIKGLTTGKLILFKTVGGKFGILNVNYSNQNSAARGTFMNIDVKIQK